MKMLIFSHFPKMGHDHELDIHKTVQRLLIIVTAPVQADWI